MAILNNIQFTHAQWFWAIPLGTVCILIYIVKTKRALPGLSLWLQGFAQQVFRYPMAAQLHSTTDTQHQSMLRSQILSGLLYFIILMLLSVSLAQPYRLGEKLPEPPQHRDIVFLVDTSVSMILQDYLVNGQRTSRLDVMKKVLSHFVNQLQGNRIQIIAYSEQAYTVVPLTIDYALLNFQIQRLDAAVLTGRSSDLSRALLYAVQPYVNQDTLAQQKPVFVMLTDAHRPVRHVDPKIAAQYVANQGIRLHTIAIGGASYAAENTQQRSLIYHPTSFYLLEHIAKTGNGQFFWAKDTQSLGAALSAINAAEKLSIQTEPQYIKQPLYMWPLLVMLVLLALSYALFIFGGSRRT